MAVVLRVNEIAESDKTVEALELPMADPLGANIETKYINSFSAENGRLHAGFWESAPGRARWEFTDGGEVIYILKGTMTVQRDGEDPVEVTAGDLVVFEQGWKGFWDVTEHLAKVYAVYS